MAEDDQITKIPLVAFFYEVGKSGNEYTMKETHRLPHKERYFDSLKQLTEYAR